MSQLLSKMILNPDEINEADLKIPKPGQYVKHDTLLF